MPPDPETLVRQAMNARLDQRALSANIDALEARASLERRKTWADLSAGPEEQGGPDGGDALAPGVSLTSPVFEQNQAQVARADSERQRMIELEKGARVAVAQDVRASVDRDDGPGADAPAVGLAGPGRGPWSEA